MAESLLHHRQHILVASALGEDQPVGREAGLDQPRREQVPPRQRPQNDTSPAGGYARHKQGGGSVGGEVGHGARDFVQRTNSEAPAR